MSLRPLVFVTLAVGCMLGAVGCGGGPDEDVTEPSPTVRLITSRTETGRWERAAEQGLGRVAAELAADVARLRAANSEQRRFMVREQGASGVNLVFCVGADFESAVFAEAPAYPDSYFIVIPGTGHGNNVGGIDFVPEGAAWVAGAVAASLGPSRSVGVIRGPGGQWLDHVESGFIKGFLSTSTRRNAVVVSDPDGPWELAEHGVEVALYASDDPQPDVYAAAHDAGILVVGTDEAMIDDEPDVVVASVTVDLAEAMVRVAREVIDGTFTGGTYAFDLASGVLDVRLNPTMPEVDLPTVQEALEQARSRVTAGIVEMEDLGF
jgi:basic membrane lipoprotein Med (substrate-binding protein (PBP1-ABC) superfamily)